MDKQFNIAEIKRTAAANGGTPLGRGRFTKATGFKQTDWYGVHRARWGEALNEAGFAANELTTAYDPIELLGVLIAQAQHGFITRPRAAVVGKLLYQFGLRAAASA